MSALDIRRTDGEARAQLEAEHTISYDDSVLGMRVGVRCTCGWRSPWFTNGWLAQEAAGRHRIAYITHPLERRAQYAIYRETCKGCGGVGALVDRDGADIGQCPFCFGGYLWMLLERTIGMETGCSSQQEATYRLDKKLRKARP